MLERISIHNFGLIDTLELDFSSRLNILTGETGAGKSIIINALRIALGDKLSSSHIRNIQKPCIIEAIFNLKNTEVLKSNLLEDFLDSEETEMIIHRSFLSNGQKKTKINGINITISQLKIISQHLMDFHGPYDHQMLLASNSHLGLLDRFIPFGQIKDSYTALYKEYQGLEKKIAEIKDLSTSKDRELDIISHQIHELEQISLQDKEYTQLQKDITRTNHTEKLSDALNQLIQYLGGNNGIDDKIHQAFSPMKRLNTIDPSTEMFKDMLTQIQSIHNQLISDLKDYSQTLAFNETETKAINKKYDTYYDILKKYGPSIQDARKYYEKHKVRFDILKNLDHNNEQFHNALNKLKLKIKKQADTITTQRKSIATSLKKTIEKELTELGMPYVRFEIHFKKVDFLPTGQDSIEFYISPNAGEDLKPMAKIVSSGESARVMLALKKALINVDPIPVLIFDEIDAQIGGRLGSITGKKLKEISEARQVLLITHLPQIASFADKHLQVKKFVKDGRTFTDVKVLSKKQRLLEIAEMMSGNEEKTIALKHAKEMLAKATIS